MDGINTSDSVTDHTRWTKASGLYQDRIGKCTFLGTERLVDKVDELLPFDANGYVLDNGCGSGSITVRVTDKCPQTPILATDLSTGMLAQVDKLGLPNVTTKRADAVTLAGVDDETFMHVLSSFMIQFTPSAQSTVQAMYRVLKP